MDINNAANITLLLKYLSGRLPVADFEIDFDQKGTPSNMLNEFFKKHVRGGKQHVTAGGCH